MFTAGYHDKDNMSPRGVQTSKNRARENAVTNTPISKVEAQSSLLLGPSGLSSAGQALSGGQMACSNRVQREASPLRKSTASSGRRSKRPRRESVPFTGDGGVCQCAGKKKKKKKKKKGRLLGLVGSRHGTIAGSPHGTLADPCIGPLHQTGRPSPSVFPLTGSGKPECEVGFTAVLASCSSLHLLSPQGTTGLLAHRSIGASLAYYSCWKLEGQKGQAVSSSRAEQRTEEQARPRHQTDRDSMHSSAKHTGPTAARDAAIVWVSVANAASQHGSPLGMTGDADPMKGD
ncbi:hypothetical protein EYF80_005652 [Liparis tanakae]|uniref:Uncharacterized protein n=1 Tax=Liparis tanakae TaxID=230148 RepID=A0A4Z2J1I8_9TELE|nr:hypothetical protein EYF80_005652 [Liparis tanakae]